jgi:hypothetical protein
MQITEANGWKQTSSTGKGRGSLTPDPMVAAVTYAPWPFTETTPLRACCSRRTTDRFQHLEIVTGSHYNPVEQWSLQLTISPNYVPASDKPYTLMDRGELCDRHATFRMDVRTTRSDGSPLRLKVRCSARWCSMPIGRMEGHNG